VLTVTEQIGDPALVEPGKPVERLKRRGVAGLAWPLLPVREVLERLRIVWPDLGPALRGLRLTPAMSLAKRYPGIDAVDGLKDDTNFCPRAACVAQLACMQRLRLPHAAWLTAHCRFFLIPQ